MFIVPLSLFLITTYLRPRTKAELSYLIAAIECLSGLWCLLFAPVQIQLSLAGLLLLRNTDRLKSLIDRTQSQKDSHLDLSDASNPAIDVEAVPVLHLLNSASQLETPKPFEPLPSLQTPPHNSTPNNSTQNYPTQNYPTQNYPTQNYPTKTETQVLSSPPIQFQTQGSVPGSTTLPTTSGILSKHYPLRFQDQTRSPIQASRAIAVFQPKRPTISLQADDSPPPNIPIILPTQRVQMRYRGTTYFKNIPTRGED